MNIDNITSINNITINRKFVDISIESIFFFFFFMLTDVKSFAIFPKHKGYFL